VWGLLTKLSATSKQVLGPHHSITKEDALALKKDERRKRLTKLPATSKCVFGDQFELGIKWINDIAFKSIVSVCILIGVLSNAGMTLLVTSKQVLGFDHTTTKEVEYALKYYVNRRLSTDILLLLLLPMSADSNPFMHI